MKLFSTLFNLATLPLEVAKDVLSVGGLLWDKDKSHTRELMEKLDEDLKRGGR